MLTPETYGRQRGVARDVQKLMASLDERITAALKRMYPASGREHTGWGNYTDIDVMPDAPPEVLDFYNRYNDTTWQLLGDDVTASIDLTVVDDYRVRALGLSFTSKASWPRRRYKQIDVPWVGHREHGFDTVTQAAVWRGEGNPPPPVTVDEMKQWVALINHQYDLVYQRAYAKWRGKLLKVNVVLREYLRETDMNLHSPRLLNVYSEYGHYQGRFEILQRNITNYERGQRDISEAEYKRMVEELPEVERLKDKFDQLSYAVSAATESRPRHDTSGVPRDFVVQYIDLLYRMRDALEQQSARKATLRVPASFKSFFAAWGGYTGATYGEVGPVGDLHVDVRASTMMGRRHSISRLDGEAALYPSGMEFDEVWLVKKGQSGGWKATWAGRTARWILASAINPTLVGGRETIETRVKADSVIQAMVEDPIGWGIIGVRGGEATYHELERKDKLPGDLYAEHLKTVREFDAEYGPWFIDLVDWRYPVAAMDMAEIQKHGLVLPAARRYPRDPGALWPNEIEHQERYGAGTLWPVGLGALGESVLFDPRNVMRMEQSTVAEDRRAAIDATRVWVDKLESADKAALREGLRKRRAWDVNVRQTLDAERKRMVSVGVDVVERKARLAKVASKMLYSADEGSGITPRERQLLNWLAEHLGYKEPNPEQYITKYSAATGFDETFYKGMATRFLADAERLLAYREARGSGGWGGKLAATDKEIETLAHQLTPESVDYDVPDSVLQWWRHQGYAVGEDWAGRYRVLTKQWFTRLEMPAESENFYRPIQYGIAAALSPGNKSGLRGGDAEGLWVSAANNISLVFLKPFGKLPDPTRALRVRLDRIAACGFYLDGDELVAVTPADVVFNGAPQIPLQGLYDFNARRWMSAR
ncbi:MAG: hypothetical protein A2W26_02385 [Acidobacteria bacterium RBG_16_64_8]|nr:MAG: hypothetical protein A2W26_02385 [Acidobacteria bacterium RBG_16_64_8]